MDSIYKSLNKNLVEKECMHDLLQDYENQKLVDTLYQSPSSHNWITQFYQKYQQQSEIKFESMSLGFTINTQYLYGLPERSDTFLLKNTDKTDPYRLYNIDLFPHQEWNATGLYSSIPYLTGHSKEFDASILWYNSAETWVDIRKYPTPNQKNKRLVNFVSETGVLEIFLIASASKNSPKKVQNLLATISGFPQLPQYATLGFHYSKWEKQTSANRIVYQNQQFEESQIPVDYFWLDLPYTEDIKYFTFNKKTFSEEDRDKMNHQLSYSQRRMVVITDPHIKQDFNYHVILKGMERQNQIVNDSEYSQIFIQNVHGQTLFGDCWPGNSAWIDYFNEYAQQFWADLYSYNVFNGTNNLYQIWIDMNEPSVFGSQEGTMKKSMIHHNKDKKRFKHGEVHNVYGLMMARATFQGLMQRDQQMIRPFILTRSVFFGAQKYAAKWTGDNLATYDEMAISINQLLTLGISGIPFVGADIPGFFGQPSDNLFMIFYQLGAFYPFFRAHGHINEKSREPYLQEEIVQEIIKESIFLRYGLIHYLYTQFFIASQTGQPILRPMWHEFPQDENTFNLTEQFMFGDSILFSPKLRKPTQEMSFFYGPSEYHFLVKYYLPPSSNWYSYTTKQLIITNQIENNSPLKDLEDNPNFFRVNLTIKDQAIFIKEGSILPIKLHRKKLSLMRAWQMPIRLEVYLDYNSEARGMLYLDDGESHRYSTHNEKVTTRYYSKIMNLIKKRNL
eukprot:403361604